MQISLDSTVNIVDTGVPEHTRNWRFRKEDRKRDRQSTSMSTPAALKLDMYATKFLNTL